VTPADRAASTDPSTLDILITTPESLYLLLTSRRAGLEGSHGILDEIHRSPRRSAARTRSVIDAEAETGRPCAIGLSATQRARRDRAVPGGFAEPGQRGRIVDAGVRSSRPQAIVPVEDMTEFSRPSDTPAGGVDRSIWPSIIRCCSS
jgi:ATP-dependent Lhr-like helicase